MGAAPRLCHASRVSPSPRLISPSLLQFTLHTPPLAQTAHNLHSLLHPPTPSSPIIPPSTYCTAGDRPPNFTSFCAPHCPAAPFLSSTCSKRRFRTLRLSTSRQTHQLLTLSSTFLDLPEHIKRLRLLR